MADYFSLEEYTRGSKELLILSANGNVVGSVEANTYEEKVLWKQGIAEMNRIMQNK